MVAERNIKYVVKVLLITRAAQKIHFTVRHPENALFLTGIFVSSSNITRDTFGEAGTPNDVAGTLSLAIPQKGDVFYNEAVFSEPNHYNDDVLLSISSDSLSNMASGIRAKNDYLSTCVPICEAMMEGYYEDLFHLRPSPPPKIKAPVRFGGYKITLYLRYEMKPGEVKEARQT